MVLIAAHVCIACWQSLRTQRDATTTSTLRYLRTCSRSSCCRVSSRSRRRHDHVLSMALEL